jgi:hypothetical protein
LIGFKLRAVGAPVKDALVGAFRDAAGERLDAIEARLARIEGVLLSPSDSNRILSDSASDSAQKRMESGEFVGLRQAQGES